MTCDYFVAIDNKLRPLLKEIDDLDKNIAEKKVQINNLKRTKSNSSSVENEKRELENPKKKVGNGI